MNADRLLELYEQISDAPDAIARLRRFVLELAVRGKLVAQDPAEESASELLKRIGAEKVQLAKTGQITREKPLPPLSEADKAFELPDGWAWARLGSLSQFVTSGSRDWAKHYSNEGAIFVRMGNLSKDHYRLRLDKIQRVQPPADGEGTRTRLEAGDILISITGDVGMLGLIPDGFGEAYINQHTAMVRPMPEMRSRYLAELFRSPFAQDQFNAPQRGIKNSFRLTDVTQFVVPLPPLGEQRRIVAKVDELMALCDRLEEARKTREETRDRLTAASLARLTALETTNQDFPAHARFALDTLPALTTRPDQIKTLRQTILNLAVRGKLVEQDPEDEPASELLKRSEKLPPPPRYAKRSPELIPGDCGLSINKPDISVPSGWLWVPLVQVARLESGHTPSRNRADWWGGDIPWMGLVDARAHNNGRIHDTIQHTNEAGLANSAARLLPEGTVCFSRTASVGYVVIMGREMATSQDFVNWVPTEAIASEWLQLVMIAERPAISRFSKGAVHQTIYYPAWLAMHVVLPPLAEQHRIVAKVDALMALCDRLEVALAQADTTRTRLLEALLHEALEPDKKTMEAAE
ncbi:restriction endonuclease subunit S [Acidimangrovimonas pyrenivorans]|uniref:Restriction endonuclease subunit S n=1 Tax=Acidimangrovimonas pyrenivorans TaxID=2030798 RepID=A0ABV7AL70_9RHOB